jgi:hypothetical protein
MMNAPQSSASPRLRRTRFFVVLAVALLSIVIVGFTSSFYLRTWWLSTYPALHETALPGYLILHGILLTLWYVGVVVQTTRIAAPASAHARRWQRCRGLLDDLGCSNRRSVAVAG